MDRRSFFSKAVVGGVAAAVNVDVSKIQDKDIRITPDMLKSLLESRQLGLTPYQALYILRFIIKDERWEVMKGAA